MYTPIGTIMVAKMGAKPVKIYPIEYWATLIREKNKPVFPTTPPMHEPHLKLPASQISLKFKFLVQTVCRILRWNGHCKVGAL